MPITMADSDKFMTMLGFAKRARKIVYGIDSLAKAKHIRLLAVSDTASQNLTDGMTKLAQRLSVPLVTVKDMEKKVGGNCKAFGITDDNMALAMAEYARSGAEGYRL